MNNREKITNDNTISKEHEEAVSKGRVRLSRRLQAVADYVKPGSRVADIGTDHGFVPVYLAQTGQAAGAIAMDVRKGPLMRAEEHIKEYERWAGQAGGMNGADAGAVSGRPFCPIEARLSDGLKELRPGEADTVIIAGMGGELEIRILEQGRHMWDSVKHWILSPQSDLCKVRQYLEANGFAIENESMVKDEGKYYTILSVTRGTMEYKRQIWYRYGKCLIERKDHTLKEFLEKERLRVQAILETFGEPGTKHMTEGQEKARQSLCLELELIKEAQDEMQ